MDIHLVDSSAQVISIIFQVVIVSNLHLMSPD